MGGRASGYTELIGFHRDYIGTTPDATIRRKATATRGIT